MTPAVRHNDGLDYVPTDKKCCSVTILRPLPEQVRWLGRTGGANGLPARDDLAARRGGLAGAVQDFMVLFVSTRRDGRRWVSWSKKRWGQPPG